MAASQGLSLARVQPLQFRSVAGEVLHGGPPGKATVEVEVEKDYQEIDRVETLKAIVQHLSLDRLGGIDMPARLAAFIPVLEARHVKKPNDAVFVDEAYRAMFGRGPDPDGRAHCLARLAQGMTPLELLLNLLESDEAHRDGLAMTRWIAAHLAGVR